MHELAQWFELRLLVLVAATVAGLLIGEPLARLFQLPGLMQMLTRTTRRLGDKLNKRDSATRAWRGLVVLGMLLLPALTLGVLLIPHPVLQGTVLALVAGMAIAPYASIAQWQKLTRGDLTLSADAYLFNDTHGLLRHRILGHATAVATGVVGIGFWYVLGGMPAAACYLVLALAAAHYTPELERNLAFGTPAALLFKAADTLPRHLLHFLLLVAGCLVPGAQPVKAGRHFFSDGPLLLATLLGLSLGGRMPSAAGARHRDWVGSGTAKPDARHLTRWLILLGVALLLWLLLLLFFLLIFSA